MECPRESLTVLATEELGLGGEGGLDVEGCSGIDGQRLPDPDDDCVRPRRWLCRTGEGRKGTDEALGGSEEDRWEGPRGK